MVYVVSRVSQKQRNKPVALAKSATTEKLSGKRERESEMRRACWVEIRCTLTDVAMVAVASPNPPPVTRHVFPAIVPPQKHVDVT